MNVFARWMTVSPGVGTTDVTSAVFGTPFSAKSAASCRVLALTVALGGDGGRCSGLLDRAADAEAALLELADLARDRRRCRATILPVALDALVLGEIELLRDELVDVRLAR